MFRELTAEDRHRAKQCLTQLDLYLMRLNSAVKELEELGLKEAALPMRTKVGDLLYDVLNLRGCLRLLGASGETDAQDM